MLTSVVTGGLMLAFGAIEPANAQTIINGGFENQTGFTGNAYDYSNTPTDWITNAAWDVSAYNAVIGSVYGRPHSGNNSVRFGSSITSSPTTLSQTFATIIGSIYTVNFYTYNGQYTGDSTSHSYNYLTASVGGRSVTVADNVGTYSNGCATCWVEESFTFTGTGSDTLSFAAKTDANYWFLDDVTVTGQALGAVPEPASWAMTILGFGLVGYAARRSKRNATVGFA